ncbi:MAG: transcription termination/antitermination NusG family protein [Candidatus Hinthialibacter antarcticus]|nr:transcription termination/antitermination NusG family protein [Candidatus Hinthialibacter antarcticus]
MLSGRLEDYADRWPHDRPIEDDRGKWRVAYVKPRNEKALAIDCQQAGVPYYLPLYVKRKRRNDNNKYRKSVMPLFPGYFPFVDTEDGKSKLQQTNRVVHILDINDQEAFVRDLEQIRHAVNSGMAVDAVPYMEEGQKVRVKEGPLQGLCGIVNRVDANHARLVITVDALKMAVEVELESESVEAL